MSRDKHASTEAIPKGWQPTQWKLTVGDGRLEAHRQWNEKKTELIVTWKLFIPAPNGWYRHFTEADAGEFRSDGDLATDLEKAKSYATDNMFRTADLFSSVAASLKEMK